MCVCLHYTLRIVPLLIELPANTNLKNWESGGRGGGGGNVYSSEGVGPSN